jgi:hypothetical protein
MKAEREINTLPVSTATLGSQDIAKLGHPPKAVKHYRPSYVARACSKQDAPATTAYVIQYNQITPVAVKGEGSLEALKECWHLSGTREAYRFLSGA